MSMDVGGAKGGIKADINVTPLVDVMLVLLIIIMLIAPMLQEGTQVRLPKATNTTDKPQSQDQSILAISASGAFYLNAQLVQEAELATKVNEVMQGKTQKLIVIKADEEVEYRAVMAAMDQLRQAGIEDIGLLTDPRETTGGSAGGQ